MHRHTQTCAFTDAASANAHARWRDKCLSARESIARQSCAGGAVHAGGLHAALLAFAGSRVAGGRAPMSSPVSLALLLERYG